MHIGPSLIKETKLQDFKTPLGYEVLEVIFVDGSKTLMTKKFVEKFQTEEPSDYTNLRDRMSKVVVNELLVILAEWGVKYEDIQNIVTRLVQSNNENLDEADCFLYGVEGGIDNRNMMHVQRVLKLKNAQSGKNNNTSSDSADKK